MQSILTADLQYSEPLYNPVCVLGDEGFRELSAVDPEADRLLQEAMEEVKKTTLMLFVEYPVPLLFNSLFKIGIRDLVMRFIP